VSRVAPAATYQARESSTAGEVTLKPFLSPTDSPTPLAFGVVSLQAAVQVEKAWRDLLAGFVNWELWGTLGWHDIRQRYRRSTLGPFWITISMGVMIAGLAVLYAGLLRQPIHDYLPYLASGLIVWGLLSTVLIEGCMAFIATGELIKQQASPLSIHVFRMLWRNIIIFFHNMVIYALILLILWTSLPATWILGLFGLIIVSINGFWIGLLLGLVSLRFRDIPQIVASGVQLLFFMTPIIWRPEQIPQNLSMIVDWNPLYYLVEVVRMPLLGELPSVSVWLVSLGIAITGCVITFAFFARFRRRVAYWV
jgi:ABC-type polysaccharide/polyol phosphate export permease